MLSGMSAVTTSASPLPPLRYVDFDLDPPRVTVEEYQRMDATGVFDDNHVELLEGLIVRKPRMEPPHSASVNVVGDEVRPLLPPGWHVRVQSDVQLADSQPQPDVAVVLGVVRDYYNRHPRPEEIAFVVEVTDSSVTRDTKLKRRIYARAGIRCYVIVHLPAQHVEVLTRPTVAVERGEPNYAEHVVLRRGEAFRLSVGDALIELHVDALLPPV